jgi:GntR family transcriptional regulator
MMIRLANLPRSSIDRASPLPFYFQLRVALMKEIVAGRWAAGDRLPSEPAICEHFGVSRTTVRQALAELEAEGLIRKEKGRGTFIREPRTSSWLLQSSYGFYDEAVAKGHRVRSQVLRRGIEPMPPWAADALGLETGADGAALERLRWVDDRLVMYVVNYLHAELADAVVGADLESGSLYRTLESEKGLRVCGGRRVVEAVGANEEVAALLEVERGTPLLYVESVSWDEDMSPFECYLAWHRSDQTKIEVQVVHEEAAVRAGLDLTTLRIGSR